MREDYGINVGDYVVLERFPHTVWEVRIVKPNYRPPPGATSGMYIGRARVDWSFGGSDLCYKNSRWEPLQDLRILEPLELLARISL